MQSRIVFVAERTSTERPKPLELVVPYTNPARTASTLEAALQLTHGLEVGITVVAVHVLPYPAPLAIQEGIRERLEAELLSIARTSPVRIRLKLVFSRDRTQALESLLRSESLVVLGTKGRWWRLREQRLARRLASHGHGVALVKVS